ncbi:MAG: GerMN domain-containing protein [Clostridia bacterium]|nr:GerMN domain-containing protein [Clostridia bacterium]
MQKWIILGVVVVLAILTTVIVFNMEIETEFVPEVEASNETLRKTNVSAYFKNKASNVVEKENILLDSKNLIKDPYNEIVSILINKPENENLVSIFPDGTAMPEIYYEKGVVTVDFKENSELLKEGINVDEIKQVLNDALKQFTEVENVVVIVDSKEL